MNKQISKWPARILCAGALLATTVGTMSSAHAQGPGGGGPGGGPGGGGFQNMTPEQRAEFQARMEARRKEQQTAWLKQALTASGVPDAGNQDAIVAYMDEQDKTLLTLRQQAQALSTKLTDPNTPADTLKADLAAFRAAVEAARTKRTEGLADLDAKVKYSTTPRVETVLTLLGVLGPEITYLGGIGTVFPSSPYGNMGGRGMGGRGGGQGGGQGGGGRGGRRGGGQGGGGGAEQ